MEKKFKESPILEDYSKALAKKNLLLGPQITPIIATTLFHGVSCCLGGIKNVSIPKAIAFRLIDGTFLAGAKVEFIKNEADPTNPAAGRWDYIWTTFEEDLEGADIIEAQSNSMVPTYFYESASQLYEMKFQDPSSTMYMTTLLLEMIIQWARDNAKENDPAVLTLPGVFKITGEVEDGEVVIGINPDGEMKVLIKDDESIQEI